jgi:hypothetical protein
VDALPILRISMEKLDAFSSHLFPADLRGAFSIFTHRSFVALRLDGRESLLSSVVVYFSWMRWCEMSRCGSSWEARSRQPGHHHRRPCQTDGHIASSLHSKEIAVHASACSSSIRHAVLIVALGVTATAYRSLSFLRGSTALLLLSPPASSIITVIDSPRSLRPVQRCLMYS